MGKTCPGIIRINGIAKRVLVVKDSVRQSPIHQDLIYLRYVDGTMKMLKNVPKRMQNETQIYKPDAYLWPHGTDKCLEQPETIELVIGIISDIYPEKIQQIKQTTEEKWAAIRKQMELEKKNDNLKKQIEETQNKMAMMK